MADTRVLIIINPKASRAPDSFGELCDWFKTRAKTHVIATHSRDELRQSLRIHGPNVDLIVLGGGDGTISHALPVLLALDKPLAVLPLGTANDLANTLGVPPNPLAAADVALNGRPHRIDVGMVNDEPFLNVASVGVAANVVHAQTPALKRRWRVFAYLIGLVHAARESKPFFVTLEADGDRKWTGPVYQVSVANGRLHGGGLTVADHAAIDDGTFDIYFVRPGTFWQMVSCISHLKFGLSSPSMLQRSCAQRVILTTKRPRSVNADGEIKTKTPATFTLRRKRLEVIVPKVLPPGHRGLSEID
jgi:diacylglycerol kinase (ATP)